MEHGLLGLVIALFAVVGGLGLPFFVMYNQNRERRALIEKGMDPNLANPFFGMGKKTDKKESSGRGPLLWGLLFAGIGLGVLSGYFIATSKGFDETTLMNAMAILFGGIALIIYYAGWGKNDSKKAE